jgi:hypothetical protein
MALSPHRAVSGESEKSDFAHNMYRDDIPGMDRESAKFFLI